MSDEGWLYLSDMMRRHPDHWPQTSTGNLSGVHPTGVRLSPEDLLWVLIWNDKARFGISIHKKAEPITGNLKPYLRLRCVNGHKLDVDPTLLGTQIHLGNQHVLDQTGIVIHGTTIGDAPDSDWGTFHSIMTNGLLPGGKYAVNGRWTGRKVVHFSTHLGNSSQGGSTCHHECDMFIVLDVVKYLQAGHVLVLSDNGVVMAYQEVMPEFWHTVVMGKDNSPVAIIPNLIHHAIKRSKRRIMSGLDFFDKCHLYPFQVRGNLTLLGSPS
jgi:RNA:NAD 2'-phosphotransferase (TPT1/KptA family)